MSVRKYEAMDDEYLDYIPMEVDNVCDLEFDAEEFKEGIRDVSYYAGFYVGLINAGIDIEDAVQILKIKMGVDTHEEVE